MTRRAACLAIAVIVPGTFWAMAEDVRSPTVGSPGHIEQVILPGSELVPRPLQDKSQPVVVRILKTFAHGDSFRYEIQFQGMEAGEYNLCDFLVRRDGSTTESLPEIRVEIRSLLPPGQIEPNPLRSRWWPALGGYRTLATAVGVAWIAGLLALIFAGHRKKRNRMEQQRQFTLAELLQERLQVAARNELLPAQYAELERMLLEFWRQHLQLDSLPYDEALRNIREHPQSGPLMTQLEQWMHGPRRDEQVDLGKLLEPFGAVAAPGREEGR
jgi:hypothetical protein